MVGLLFAAILNISNASLHPEPPVVGNYVEVRTASVFAGACHYNGEALTTGRDAVLAVTIRSGSWNHVDLSDVRIAAAVSSSMNLSEAMVPHHCEIVVDSAATEAQVAAALGWLKSNCHSIGTIDHVRRGEIKMTTDAEHVAFDAKGFASADILPMPNHECCKQPNLVWYQPMMELNHRLVGYTQSAAYSAGVISDRWERADENSAFYGSF